MNTEKQLKLFVQSFSRNQWLRDDCMRVYVRKGLHHLNDGKSHSTLDIASIEILPECRGNGIFKSFLSAAHQLNPFDYVYIECVSNPMMKNYLDRSGWTRVKELKIDYCYYKKSDNNYV